MVKREENIFSKFVIQDDRILLGLVVENGQELIGKDAQFSSTRWRLGLPDGQLTYLDATWLEL